MAYTSIANKYKQQRDELKDVLKLKGQESRLYL